MTTLIVGATGATGKLLVEHLIQSGNQVKVIVRPASNYPASWKNHEKLTIIEKQLTDLSPEDIRTYASDCNAVASCLGHTPTWKGIFGSPRKLVTQSIQMLCGAILALKPDKPIKLVLMNTAGNSNRDLDERVSLGQRVVIALLRVLLPPHVDNEQAADFLRAKIGQKHPFIEWSVVRPDTLLDEENPSPYSLHISPTRSAIFNPGKTSRVNVAHFMGRLILEEDTWAQWKGKMPIIYNETGEDKA